MNILQKALGVGMLAGFLCSFVSLGVAAPETTASESPAPSHALRWDALRSPVLFQGDTVTAYRDPAAVFHDGVFHLYFTLVKTEADGKPYSFTAWSQSRDLAHWTEPKTFTPRDRGLNFCSPGNVIRFSNQWVLCVSSYPRPHGEKFGNESARLWIMRSDDLENWSSPELLRVKGPEVPVENMGRMIDPYLLEDKDEPGKWWCFFKQNGASRAWSRDLKSWNYAGHVPAGENVCVLVEGGEYVMFHSPANGIGVKRSRDLKQWREEGLLTLGQKDWPWAKGRLTAGFVLDLRGEPGVGKFIMFFHGSGPEDERTMFDNFASIGLAWSEDLKTWHWLGQGETTAAGRRGEIRLLAAPELGFFSKILDADGIPIKAHQDVVDEALLAARDRLSMMLSNLPTARASLRQAGAELHIIGRNQVTSDLPENRHLKGKPFDGKLTVDERTRGLGGLLTSCGEENLLSLEKDRYRGRDICVHEFAHNIFQHGAPKPMREKFGAQRKRSLNHGLWVDSYAGGNVDEFFAELSMWYFGTHGDLHMKGRKPANGRDGLRAYDPEACALMDDFYSGKLAVPPPAPTLKN